MRSVPSLHIHSILRRRPKKELCIVHVGMPKTGSSALQANLFSGIADPAVRYSDLGEVNHGPIVFSLFAQDPGRLYWHRNRGSTPAQIKAENRINKEQLVASFTDPGTSTEIISGESLIHLGKVGLKNLRKLLSKYFKRVIIVAYIRSPKSYMQSAFQQFVKCHDMQEFNFRKIYPHYRRKLKKFDYYFGRKNVYLWKFSPSSFPSGDITQDFCKRLNIQFDPKQVLRDNETVSKEIISMLFLFNKAGKQVDSTDMLKLNYEFVELLRPIGTHKFTFANSLVEEVLAKHEEDIQWIEGRLGEQFSDLPPDIPGAVQDEDELYEYATKSCAELKTLLSSRNIETSRFGCSREDIVDMMFELKTDLAVELGLLPDNV